ncbi:hypothetical protein [Barrientosiimonas endolithica]|uniref:YcaO domain-containing protein n=1 Tax=Barrientosiimonas endolithica TaxID=1535208 RepID=A0ABN6YRT2_9MICO|nr:hypothetical protein [Barrientosiimonas endolithica]BDZ60109.1 hypothetical protein GCM10025872_37660 [Barrientosiimonas endolithica]
MPSDPVCPGGYPQVARAPADIVIQAACEQLCGAMERVMTLPTAPCWAIDHRVGVYSGDTSSQVRVGIATTIVGPGCSIGWCAGRASSQESARLAAKKATAAMAVSSSQRRVTGQGYGRQPERGLRTG